MKPMHRVKDRTTRLTLAALWISLALLVPAANADEAVVQRAGSVSYVSGGVGSESIDRLDALAREFNLKLVFALQSGEYLSDVQVVIADAKGQTLLDARSDGPWFLAKLPAGNYQVSATYAGRSEKRQVAVSATRLRTVDFRWRNE